MEKTTRFESKYLTWENINQVIDAFYTYVTNSRMNDKYAAAYFVGMIDCHQGIYASHMKRTELNQLILKLLDEKTIYKVIQSQYTANAIWNILIERKKAHTI